MQVEGIEGVVQAKGYEKWIELYSFEYDSFRNISQATSSGEDRIHSLGYVSDITVSKLMDMTTPQLFLEVCQGTAKKVVIHQVEFGDEGPKPYVKYEFSNVLFSRYYVSTNPSDIPFETWALNFTKLEVTYVNYDATAKQNKPIVATFDLTQVN
jgi:type VI secretion system secreted protein Hcp